MRSREGGYPHTADFKTLPVLKAHESRFVDAGIAGYFLRGHQVRVHGDIVSAEKDAKAADVV